MPSAGLIEKDLEISVGWIVYGGGGGGTDDLFIRATAPHEGMQVDNLPLTVHIIIMPMNKKTNKLTTMCLTS